jgi:hypothetical protein
MSIDASEYNSATANSSGGNRAPPPSFSSQSFAQGQRKRPALNNLGIEVSLASDVKTPNTPTPNLNNEILSSDNLLHTKPTPTPPHQNSHSGISYNYHSPFPSREDEFKEPQLLTILDALSDFQCHYDQKSQKIDTLVRISISLVCYIYIQLLGKTTPTSVLSAKYSRKRTTTSILRKN